MFKQKRKIIGRSEKVEIIYKGDSFFAKKQDLFDKISILCQNTNNPELNFILGMIIAIKAIKLEEGIIYCYFKRDNYDEDRPEGEIQRQSDLYKLLKGMKHFE